MSDTNIGNKTSGKHGGSQVLTKPLPSADKYFTLISWVLSHKLPDTAQNILTEGLATGFQSMDPTLTGEEVEFVVILTLEILSKIALGCVTASGDRSLWYIDKQFMDGMVHLGDSLPIDQDFAIRSGFNPGNVKYILLRVQLIISGDIELADLTDNWLPESSIFPQTVVQQLVTFMTKEAARLIMRRVDFASANNGVLVDQPKIARCMGFSS
jgi:hypothetical protein